MSNDTQFIGGVEPMVDAKPPPHCVSAVLLVYRSAMRSKYKRIPHYLMGGLVRYRPIRTVGVGGTQGPARRSATGSTSPT